jgi:integrase
MGTIMGREKLDMTRGLHKLSAGTLRTRKPGYFSDGGGLYLRVTAGDDGEVWRSWAGRYSLHGRAREMGLGPVAELGLAEVRELWHRELRPLLRKGLDPIEVRKAGRVAQATAAARAATVDECISAVYEAHSSTWRNAKHRRIWLSSLHKIFSPVIGGMPVAAVERSDIVRALQPHWSKAQDSALRTAWRLKAVLDWAIAAKYRAEPNPAQWSGGLEHLLPRSKILGDTRHAALPYRELPAFMDKLRASDRIAARALEFLILTAARTNEVLGACWSEIDIAAAVWTVPAERMKAGREHKVPIGVRGLALLQALPRRDERIFPIGAVAMLRLLTPLGYGEFTVHGFRSSFRDWAAEQTNFAREVAEVALAHAVGNETERAYQRGNIFEKRRRLMDAWAGYLARPAPAGVVTPMRRSDPHG